MPRGRTKLIYNSSPGGIRGDLNPATIPDGEWLSSNNVLVRDGRSVMRPGILNPYSPVAAADPVVGLMISQSDAYHAFTLTLVQTKTKTYMFNAGTTTDLTGTWTSSSQPTRFDRFFSTSDYLLRVNPDNKLAKSTGVISPADPFATISAAPSIAYDLCTVPPYCILGGTVGGTYSNAISWCAANDIDTWPASNTNTFPGREFVSSVRQIDSRAFAIFTRTALFVGQLQAAKTAFQFARVAKIYGPSGPNNVVNTPHGTFWIGNNNTIYHFDGSGIRAVSSSFARLWRSQAVSTTNDGSRYPIGSYVQRDRPEIWWFYQYSSGYAAIVLDIETSKVFPVDFGSLAIMSVAPTCGVVASSFTEAVLGGSAGQIYYLQPDQYTDDGTAIPWNFEFGYRPLTDVEDLGKLDGVASYFKKTSSSCTVTVSVTLSDGIDDSETATTDTFDTNTAGNHLKTFRSLDRKKWIKLKYSGTQVVADLEYRGSIVTAWERSMI